MVKEFECSSLKKFLAWKEEEEEIKVFYAHSTGRKALNDCTNTGEIGMSINSMQQLLLLVFWSPIIIPRLQQLLLFMLLRRKASPKS